jgi:hypothetical protein
MPAHTQLLLEQHFAGLTAVRKTRNNPVYALEHGLEPSTIVDAEPRAPSFKRRGCLITTGWYGQSWQRKRAMATKARNTGQRLSMFPTSGATTTTEHGCDVVSSGSATYSAAPFPWVVGQSISASFPGQSPTPSFRDTSKRTSLDTFTIYGSNSVRLPMLRPNDLGRFCWTDTMMPPRGSPISFNRLS